MAEKEVKQTTGPKPNWEVTFIADGIFQKAAAGWLAWNESVNDEDFIVMGSKDFDSAMDRLVDGACLAALAFKRRAKIHGLHHDIVTDKIGEDGE